jgi:hypothetical protein
MSRVKVIAYAHLPARLPIGLSLLCWLMIDRLHPPDVWKHIVYTLLGIMWACAVINMFSQDTREPKWEDG